VQLTSFTDYSLRTLIYLALHQGRLCTAREISEFHHISSHHIVKIVHNLAKIGLIRSIKGKGGGICLATSADQINIGDLVARLEPSFYIAKCFNTEFNNCALLPDCRFKNILSDALQAFFNTLSQYTLADIIDLKEN